MLRCVFKDVWMRDTECMLMHVHLIYKQGGRAECNIHALPGLFCNIWGSYVVTLLMGPALAQFWVEINTYVIENPEDRITF